MSFPISRPRTGHQVPLRKLYCVARSWRDEPGATPGPSERPFCKPEIFDSDAGTGASAPIAVELDHVAMNPCLTVKFRAVDELQVVVGNVAPTVPPSPRLIVAIALLPRFPSPGDGARVSTVQLQTHGNSTPVNQATAFVSRYVCKVP